MFQGEPSHKSESTNRPIRMLPYALAAGLGVYLVLSWSGLSGLWVPVLAASAAGWVLGRLTRR